MNSKTKLVIVGISIFLLMTGLTIAQSVSNKNKVIGSNIKLETTSEEITKITAMERDYGNIHYDENGVLMATLAVNYQVVVNGNPTYSYISYDAVPVTVNMDDVDTNNLLKKSAIQRHALEKWGWDLQLQQFIYNKLSRGNQ